MACPSWVPEADERGRKGGIKARRDDPEGFGRTCHRRNLAEAAFSVIKERLPALQNSDMSQSHKDCLGRLFSFRPSH